MPNNITKYFLKCRDVYDGAMPKSMDNKGLSVDNMSSTVSINADLNTASTLKLAENDVIQRNKLNEALGKSDTELYIPSEYRDKSLGTPDSGALLHLLKSSLGSGILAMPMAFKNGGLVFGIIGSILTGLLCTHCVHLLVYCSQVLSVRTKKPSLGFAETAEVAFQTGPPKYKNWASFAREFVHASLFATYYFGNTVYVVFMAQSFQQVIENIYELDLNIRLYILALAVPLVPLGIIRTLKVLVPFSAIATAFIMFGLSITLYYTFVDLPSIETREYIASPAKWPLFFSTVLFAMEGIGTVLPIENSMLNPHHFLGCPGVLNIAMTVVVALYASVGFCGYLKYGEDTLGSITLNLGTTKLAELVKVLVALSILFTYGLQFTVPSEIVWKKLSSKVSEKHQEKGYYIMRGLMIMGTIIIAIIIPELGPFISLVGSVCFSILGLFCPVVVETITRYEDGFGYMRWRLWKNILITILAAFALVSGSYASIIDIIAAYQ
ncbi:proton-coupled amino acid transporter-like protein pathetic isoform X1 [Halyomorpha halys]|uniref:proton-coupled amino acid transporter-like protein pathetic isoform X1 n=2 Tax=Halyomorpha halys TaxID=286706 RepID=UPI0006D50618|nr:proton-coupled amino acid transporter-like protein pathetic isoform X1 [Halyomorpha halys]KAE8573825.1 hypothetical protein A483_HHAL011650 [Halyomorpha halys]